jgi:hypothetical protein
MTFKRMPLSPATSRAIRGERDGGPRMRPDDVAWSDVGEWGSVGDVVADCECTGCGRRGTAANIIARDDLCWSCWARSAREPDMPDKTGTA